MKTFSSGLAVIWLCSMTVVKAIYPEGHFSLVTEIQDREALDSFVTTASSNGKTAFVRWIASSG
jgi:hypothetical protein